MLEIMQHKKEKKEVKKHLNAEALEPLETLPPQILMALKTLVMMQLRRVDRQNVGCQSPGNKVSVPVEDKKMVGFLECFRELDGWREIHRTRKLSFFPFTEKVEYHKFVCSDREKLLSFLKSFKIEEDVSPIFEQHFLVRTTKVQSMKPPKEGKGKKKPEIIRLDIKDAEKMNNFRLFRLVEQAKKDAQWRFHIPVRVESSKLSLGEYHKPASLIEGTGKSPKSYGNFVVEYVINAYKNGVGMLRFSSRYTKSLNGQRDGN